MLTIEKVKTEYNRISKMLGIEALNGTHYNTNCEEGCTIWYIKKELGLTYNQMKKEIDVPLATSKNNKGGSQKESKRIECLRGGKHMISASKCVPYCNDICHNCKDIQLQNKKAGGEILTKEEEKELACTGVMGGQFGRMIEEEI